MKQKKRKIAHDDTINRKGTNMIPPYVPTSLIKKERISHKWSNWDPYELIAEANEDTIQALSTVSLSGILCFVIGCIEWATYRCSYDDNYSLPFEYIEAFWVYIAGVEEALPEEATNDDRWEGPLDGPINLLIGKFYTTNHTYDFGGSPIEAALSAQVVLHVLHDQDPFLSWQSDVLDRLIKYSASDVSEDNFNPLAQQILDPNFDYRPDQVNVLIKNMLLRVDLVSNRFLSHVSKEVLEQAKKL